MNFRLLEVLRSVMTEVTVSSSYYYTVCIRDISIDMANSNEVAESGRIFHS